MKDGRKIVIPIIPTDNEELLMNSPKVKVIQKLG
jgi:hypothetical protein